MLSTYEHDRTPVLAQGIAAGSVVRLQSVEDASEWEVTIVTTEEADPELNHISDECPIGVALLGRNPGDVVVVDVPLGTVQYRVVSVEKQPSREAAQA